MASPVVHEITHGFMRTFSDEFSNALRILECVERNCILTSFNKDQIKTLKLELFFLKTIFKYEGAHCFVDEDLMDLLKTIFRIIVEAGLSFSVALHNGAHQVSFDPLFHDILENIEVIKTRARDHYLVLLFSLPGCRRYMNCPEAKEFILELLENLEILLRSKADDELFSPLREEIEGLEERLMYLENCLEFMKWCINEKELLSDLSSQIAIVVDHAALACISFFFWTEKITGSGVCRVNMTLNLSRLHQRMKSTCSRLEPNEIFTGLCRASKFLQLYKYKFQMEMERRDDFVRFLVQNLMELLDTKRLEIPAVKDHVEALCEDLRRETQLFFDPGDSILMHIEALKNAIVSFDDLQVRKMMKSLSISRLQEDVKLIYAEGTLDIEVHNKTGKKWWMVHPFDDDHLQCLEWQDRHRNMSDQLQFHHIIYKVKLLFGYIQMCQKQLIQHPCFGIASWYMRSDVKRYMHAICIAIKYGMLDGTYCHLSKLQFYLCRHADGYNYMLKNDEAVVELLGSLLGNLQILLQIQSLGGSLQESIELLAEKLRFLRDVVNFVSEEKLEEDIICCSFLNQIKTMCTEAISLSCQWYIHKDRKTIMWHDMSSLTPKIDKIVKEFKEISFKKATIAVSSNSESSLMMNIELVMFAIYFVQQDLGDLLNSNSGWMIPLKSQIETLHKGSRLIWLGFPKSLPEQKQFITDEHEKLKNLFSSIAALAIETQSLIHYSYPKTSSQAMAKEIDSVLLYMILAMKLIISIQSTLMVMEMEMLNSKPIASAAYQKQEQVVTLHTGLKFLITYLIDLPRQYINNEKHIHALIEVVASEADDVIRSHFTNDKEGLLLLLMKIKLIHAKVSLVEVLTCKATAGLSAQLVTDGVETLQQEFELLEILLADFPKEYYEDEKLKNLVALVDKVVTEAGEMCKGIRVTEMNNVEMAGELHQRILGLLGKFAAIKMADRENFPNVSRSSFPKPYILGFVEFLIGKIKDLRQYKPDLVSSLGNEIQSLQVELDFLITSLRDISAKHSRSFWSHVADVAYKAEHAIDSFISSKGGTFWKDMLCLCITEINLLMMEVASVNAGLEKNDGNLLLQNVDESSTALISTKAANALETIEVVVGFEDEEAKIKEKLMNKQTELDVISIVGMPGLGKTTLAKKIYNHYSKVAKSRHFDVCSSCCVSQAYEKKELLLDLLSKSFDNLEELRKKTEGNLSAILQNSLKGKRYLIFIDDIWSKDAWDDLKALFPKENKSSRILLTTRLEEVASYATECSKPHYLRLLRPDESWSLLQQKIFQNETCPEKLEDVGKIIAEKCKGLPLSIVLIAGLLQKTVKERHWWESVVESFSSHVNTSRVIVELSYKHLPPYLKPCFLYFGGFQEDEEVPVSKLIWLWLAEGFIQVQDQVAIRSLELAQNYLMDLVGRSLVMKSKIAYDGKIKTCRVHDLLHEFCQKKAREENFLLRINGDYHADSPHCYSKKPAQRRLSIFSTRETFAEWNPSKSSVRSLIVKVTSNDIHRSQNHDVLSILQSFNLLRVLDVQCIYLANFPEELYHLIHLSYLAVRTGSNSIPSSIANLWNLQTFLFKGQRGEVCLPESLWNMVHLKNVHINDRASLEQYKYRHEFFQNSAQLANLETFSTPSLSFGDDMEKIIMRLSNLRKLKCRFSESWGYSKKLRKMCNRFPVLNVLGELESLKVLYNSREVRHPCEFNFPSNLKKLTLSNFRLRWSEISQLGALQNLEVLKLVFRAFDGEEWRVGDEEFLKLKLLKLDNLNLVRWKVSDGAFPCLEKLVLIKCNEIKEMPTESLGDITCLCSIEIKWCSRSAAICAKEIQENRSELGDDGLRVLILPPDWYSRT